MRFLGSIRYFFWTYFYFSSLVLESENRMLWTADGMYKIQNYAIISRKATHFEITRRFRNHIGNNMSDACQNKAPIATINRKFYSTIICIVYISFLINPLFRMTAHVFRLLIIFKYFEGKKIWNWFWHSVKVLMQLIHKHGMCYVEHWARCQAKRVVSHVLF